VTDELQQQYRITEFGRSAEFPRIPWNSAETWKFRGSAWNSAARGKLWSLDISLFQLNHTLDISQVCQMILFSINVDADNNPEMNVT